MCSGSPSTLGFLSRFLSSSPQTRLFPSHPMPRFNYFLLQVWRHLTQSNNGHSGTTQGTFLCWADEVPGKRDGWENTWRGYQPWLPTTCDSEFFICEGDRGQGFAYLTGVTQELPETICEKIPWQTKHNIKCCLLILGESKHWSVFIVFMCIRRPSVSHHTPALWPHRHNAHWQTRFSRNCIILVL